MKAIFVAIQATVILCIFIASYYLGRPMYWSFVSRNSDSIFPITLAAPRDNGIVKNINDSTTLATSTTQDNGIFNKISDSISLATPTTPQDNATIEDTTGKILEEEITHEAHGIFWEREIWNRPLKGRKMPPLEAFDLTIDMVQYRAKNNVIVVTFANYGFLEFVINWAKHLTELQVFNILVGAMDAEILEALYLEGIPVFNMGSNTSTMDVGWGTPEFNKMGREKVILVNKFLSFGVELLLCDTDMVWLKNPLPYLARYPEADMLVSSDDLINSVDDDSLEVWHRSRGAYNIGIFHWRPTKSSKKFALEWKIQLLTDATLWDQNGFNVLMKRKLGPSINKTRLFYAYDGTLKLGILPVSIFCSGHTYFVQALYKQLGLSPYAIHATYQFNGPIGKRHRMREAKVFYDKPSYYDSPGGFLSFQPRIPMELLVPGRNSLEDHFNLLNYQIKQIRDALAIASLLGRTLVMPELWCRFERLWYGHPGIIPGTKTKQPYLCPMDQVFEIKNMLSKDDETIYGPSIGFREYSFLRNPRLPKRVSESKLKVKLCDKDDVLWAQTTGGTVRRVRLPRNSTDEKIISALSPFTNIKVLVFLSMKDAFGGFTNKEREEKFRRRVTSYTGAWCCLQGVDIGHIYYDIYWDEKPNWKPLPPRTLNDGHPPFHLRS